MRDDQGCQVNNKKAEGLRERLLAKGKALVGLHFNEQVRRASVTAFCPRQELRLGKARFQFAQTGRCQRQAIDAN